MENLIKLEKNILKNYLYDKVNNKRDLEYFIKLSKYIQQRINRSKYLQESKIKKIDKIVREFFSCLYLYFKEAELFP